MAKQLLSLCAVPKLANKDGGVGALARILIPFYGYWYAGGQVLTGTGGTVAQDTSIVSGGRSKPNTYSKGAGICLKP